MDWGETQKITSESPKWAKALRSEVISIDLVTQ
jgi:hypothetical protein